MCATNIWTFTGLVNVKLTGLEPIELTSALFLYGPDKRLLGAPTQMDLNQHQLAIHRETGCFLVHRVGHSTIHASEWDGYKSTLQDALMSFQILKPLATGGFYFQCKESDDRILPPFSLEARSPMDPGQWPRLRTFDASLVKEVPGMIAKVAIITSGAQVRMKNAIYLFQLALEHHHPAIACLLAVSSIEAVLDTSGANDFEEKLCNLLGADSRVFPDWNSPDYEQPHYTVRELAYDLHKLRSKIVHGDDLRNAKGKSGDPIDFSQLRPFLQERADPSYRELLYQSSICLAAKALQKRI